MLVKDSPLRGGNFQPREVRDLPLPLLNPISLARILPGATEAAGSTVTSGVANTGGFSINGQRPRGNNYMLDGTDNNEVWLIGEEQVFVPVRVSMRRGLDLHEVCDYERNLYSRA